MPELLYLKWLSALANRAERNTLSPATLLALVGGQSLAEGAMMQCTYPMKFVCGTAVRFPFNEGLGCQWGNIKTFKMIELSVTK
jgi:hypothetical protein